MNLENLFKRFKSPPKEEIDIQINSKSIVYKYAEKQNHPDQHKHKIQALEAIKGKELSTKTISPNRDEVNFTNERTKSNILYHFENYIIYNKVLGEGAFSRVYLGEFKKSKKLVAIKQVQKLQENEIACLMNSDCPHIIRLYDFWSVDKYSYIALELCEGNLREKLDKTDIEEKVSYFEQIVEGMNYLNKKNIIHRDLKFQNILLKNNIVKISDFGFAKPIGSKLAVFSQKCGTPYTMAPQIFFHQGQGKPVYSHKCDIYSLGVILHEMMYKKHPFDYSAEKMKANQRVYLIKKFGVLDVLIDRCLEQQVAKRCNWNEFMQIFTLFRMKKPQQNFSLLQQKNKNLPDLKYQNAKNHKRPETTNIPKYKKNVFETPTKNQPEKENNKENQNPFYKINLPVKQNNLKKAEKRKPEHDPFQRREREQNFVERKLREQDWKIQQDMYFENWPQKQRQFENDKISGVKLIFLVIVILSLIVLFHKELQ